MNIDINELMKLESNLFKAHEDLEYTLRSIKETKNIISSLIEKEVKQWQKIEDYDDFFYEIRVEISLLFTLDELQQISGCLGYALREQLAGEPLSDYRFEVKDKRITVLEYYYDATKSQRDDPDFIEAFRKAEQYILEGTPIRKTDRAGRGTKGTRLVEGVGKTFPKDVNVEIEFYVR
jgi:quinol monooxygenase YgiN